MKSRFIPATALLLGISCSPLYAQGIGHSPSYPLAGQFQPTSADQHSARSNDVDHHIRRIPPIASGDTETAALTNPATRDIHRLVSVDQTAPPANTLPPSNTLPPANSLPPRPAAPVEHKTSVESADTPSEAFEGHDPYLQSGCTGCTDDQCTSCCAPCCPTWYGGVYGIFMDRDDENPVYFSFDDTNEAIQLLRSREADMDTSGGMEVHLGRSIGCGCRHFLETIYWGVYPDQSESNIFASDLAGNLNTPLDYSRLNVTQVDPNTLVVSQTSADGIFNAAMRHRLRRDYAFHNFEFNLVSGSYHSDYGSQYLDVHWLLGLRYFKFDENFQIASDIGDTTFNPTDPLSFNDEIYYDIIVDNDLIGPQLGFELDYYLSRRWHLVCGTKFGLFGNHIRHHSRIYNGHGSAVVGAGPNAGRLFNIQSNKNDVAFLGEFRLGTTYRVTSRMRVAVGYRALALTGVAMPTTQIPVEAFADIDGVADIDSNGSLILHGGYAGVEFIW